MASAKSRFGCENGPPLQNKFRSPTPPLRKFLQLRKHLLAHECHFAAQELHFAAAKWLRNPQSVKSPIFTAIAQFRRVFRSCETPLWHTSAISQHNNPISQLRNGLRNVLRKGPPSAKMPFLPKKTQKQSNLPSSPSHLNLGRLRLRPFPPVSHGKNRGAQSSSPSSRKRAAPQTPVQGYTSKPPRPPRVPPIVKGAPMSPPVRRYQTRASSQPPKKKAKVSEPALIDLSEPEEPSSEPQPPQPPPTDSQIPPAWLLRARPFHSELCFDAATFRLQPELKDPSICFRDGRHGIMGARHIAEALRIPYEPARPEDYRVWTNPSPSDIVRILSRGASTHQYLMRKELPPSMFFIDALLRHNIFPLQHWVQRRGVLLEALFRISEGFFFGPHHLIMAALLYFEEKVHKKKLLRADAIPLLFPRARSPSWSRASRDSHVEQPQEPQPIETPADTRAPAPAVPSAEPYLRLHPLLLLPHHDLPLLFQLYQSPPLHLSLGLPFPRAIIATQTQHTAILRGRFSHLGIPSAPEHQMPAPLEPTEPTPGDTQTST
ncbi:hypothetical protein CK203_066497 [Vitis vinifera]|uniref:Uncharacterized protein n=1 Tax=Vitis vinifera TaxID=29760 RepID=A0A438G2A2_VITVI|nr:hypothetical protein CK203_066497 [Vitis vinifera]